MRSYIGSLSLVLALTACAPFSKHDSVRGDAGEKAKQQEQEKAEQQEQYNTWFQSLTPAQQARVILRQHERALSP